MQSQILGMNGYIQLSCVFHISSTNCHLTIAKHKIISMDLPHHDNLTLLKHKLAAISQEHCVKDINVM